MIGMQALGLHVQLSSRQGARGAGQLKEKRRDLCHRRSVYHHGKTDRQPDRHTETDRQTEAQPMETSWRKKEEL